MTFRERLSRKLSQSPLWGLLVGYSLYILAGWLLLCLPFMAEDQTVGVLDNLFIATSAVSTTGLVTVNTPEAYSFWGEVVVMLLFQAGGLGYMTLGSFVILACRRPLSESRTQITRAAFSLPEGFEPTRFVAQVVAFGLAFEIAGAAALYAAFGRAGVEQPLWPAVFHSVSAFCTAGFSVFPNSLEDFRADFWVNAIVTILSLGGAIGFLVMADITEWLAGRRERTTLTTRIVLSATAWSIALGWLLLFLMEPGFKELPAEERLLASGFQAMTALTTVGFNTHPIGELSSAVVLVTLVLMILGASPSGTGGGLKSTSVTAALAVLWSTLHGRETTTFWGRQVPEHRLHTAFAALVFYVSTFLVGSVLLLMVQTQAFEDVLFEAASALGTVGLSRGLTGDLTPVGKLIVIALMFVGRMGPLSVGLALFRRPGGAPTAEPEAIPIADISVG